MGPSLRCCDSYHDTGALDLRRREKVCTIMGMGSRKLRDPVMADTCMQGSGSPLDLRDLWAGHGDDPRCCHL